MTQDSQTMATPQEVTNASLSNTLRALRDSFCAGLDERICRMETAWANARAGHSSTSDALAVIEVDAHRISGIAGSLGLPDIGQRAYALEMRILQARKDALTADGINQLDAEINSFLDHLEQELSDI